MSACTHCDEEILVPVFDEEDTKHESPFCCNGCLTVFNVINHKGLKEYYEIKKQSSVFKRRSPVENKFQQFSYLDNPDFLQDYSYQNSQKRTTMEFYLEGIHCLACLWLIEKMPEYLDDVENARLDIQKSVVTVILKGQGKFSNVARELNNLGYKPHPLKRNQSIRDFKNREERKMLLKIGIAGAGAGNIMLYAVSIYAGADAKFASIFNLFTVIFAIPVLFYSATPFYKTAWAALKNKTLSIDIPISMALLLGAFYGIYNEIMGINENFFDSLTALVFLLLLSRYFLNRIQEDGLTANDLNFFYEGTSVFKKNGDQFVEIHPQFLKENDIIKIGLNEMIPADGVVIEGHSLINNSLLTGESRPEEINQGSEVFSGTFNLSHEILVQVKVVKEKTRLGQILKEIENGWIQKSPIVELTNKISKYFVAAVFMLAITLFAFLMSKGDLKTALERSLTLLIVTCPCALALATPLTLTRTLSRASRLGIIIKNNEIVEKLAGIKTIFFDKTGTLTYGSLKVNHFKIFKMPLVPIYEVVHSLEVSSTHPVAHALRTFAIENGGQKKHPLVDYKEIMGSGVSAFIDHNFYEIRQGKIFENEIFIAEFSLEDHLRPDTAETVKNLRQLGLNINMISGDRSDVAIPLGLSAGIKSGNIFAQMSPEDKLAVIEKNPHSLMVGDGANDAMALSRSYVSVAVLGSLDISLRASDIYLTTPGISPLVSLIIICRETMKVVRRNLVLSLLYNSVSVYAAFTGLISPLVAAIIMPLSSLTVLISTLIGTRALNAQLKIKKEV